MDRQWGVDLANVESLEKSNDGIKYWLIVIDTFSKFLFVEMIKNKKAITVLNAFMKILNSGRRTEVVSSDKDGEFNNALFKRELKKFHIKYFTTQNEDMKNSVAERVIRTLRNKLYRLFQRQRSYRYIEVLPEIVKSCNKTKHRSLGNMAPIDVNKDNEAMVWDKMYNDAPFVNRKETETSSPKGNDRSPESQQVIKIFE